MNIGDKFLVINEAPYHTIMGHNKTPTEHHVLEVISVHDDAVGEFDGSIGTGYLAKCSDGYLYGYDYPIRNQGYGNSSWVLHMPNDVFNNLSKKEQSKIIDDIPHYWHDITLYQCPGEASFAKDLDFIGYCETHQRHFYDRNGCVRCNMKSKRKLDIVMNMQEHAWAGWYEKR